MNTDFIDNWKNKNVFEKQLELNVQELSSNPYPNHWVSYLKALDLIPSQNKMILKDIGCGCGAYSKLTWDHEPTIKYVGYDYSEEAITLAKESWTHGTFEVKNFENFTEKDFKNGEVMHACSLHNILPDGDACMNFLLSLKPCWAIFGKVLFTGGQSYHTTYKAYGEIITYMFFHNKTNLLNMIESHGYEIQEIDPTRELTNLLLKRTHV